MSATASAVHSLWTTAAAAAPLDKIPAPKIEYAQLSPVLVVFGAAVIGILIEAFLPRRSRYVAQLGTTVVGLAAAFAAVVALAADGYAGAKGHVAAMGAVAVDGPALFLQGTILLVALVASFTFAERRLDPQAHGRHVDSFAAQGSAVPGSEQEKSAVKAGFTTTEVFPLTLFAVGGILLFPAANDLLTMFVALEVLSLPLYLLCGLARRRRLLSQEAALKYFLLGAFASAVFLFGTALLYGYAGSLTLSGIATAVDERGATSMALTGVGLLTAGLLFKVGAVPFHSWVPDVYQGAPTPVTAFMAAGTKVAAFGALLRLLYVAFGGERWSWVPMLWVVAIASMVLGAALAVVQNDVKRMLAYSSVAHTGFLLVGVLGVQSADELASGQYTSLEGVLFYLTTYGFAMIGSFALVTLVRDSAGEATSFTKWAGLGKRSPLVAGAFTFFLLSMAGIPLTAGFLGKWAVFTSAMSAGAWPVVIIAIASSIIAVFFYIRYVRLMFFSEAEPGADGTVTMPSLLTSATVVVCLVATLVLGVVPGPFLDLLPGAGDFIR